MTIFHSQITPTSADFRQNRAEMVRLIEQMRALEGRAGEVLVMVEGKG